MQDLKLAVSPPHPFLFLSGPALDAAVPGDASENAPTSSGNCLSLWVLPDVGGETEVTLSAAFAPWLGSPAFRGSLPCPKGNLALTDSAGRVLAEAQAGPGEVEVAVYVSAPVHPDRVWIRVGLALRS